MTDRPAAPRIVPVALDECTEFQRELLAGVNVDGNPDSFAANIFTTLVRHPGLFRRWLPFGGKLLSGKLPARDRELLILRTGWNCRSVYEWGQHVGIGRHAGLTDDEIARVTRGPDAPGWSEGERMLLRAADELHHDACLSEPTWSALARVYDEPALIEVPMLVGHYHMVAFTLNSLGVQREPGVEGWPVEETPPR